MRASRPGTCSSQCPSHNLSAYARGLWYIRAAHYPAESNLSQHCRHAISLSVALLLYVFLDSVAPDRYNEPAIIPFRRHLQCAKFLLRLAISPVLSMPSHGIWQAFRPRLPSQLSYSRDHAINLNISVKFGLHTIVLHSEYGSSVSSSAHGRAILLVVLPVTSITSLFFVHDAGECSLLRSRSIETNTPEFEAH